jgi:hypothetical protein
VSANEYLNAFAKARAGGKTRVVAVNWGIWSDVGMAADAMDARTGGTPPPMEPAGVPMLDVASFDRAGNRVFTADYRTDRWVVGEHRTKAGDALLPGTGYLELIAEALAAQGEDGPFEIRNLYFLRPLLVADQGATALRLTLPRADAGYDLVVEAGPAGFAMERTAEASLSLMPLARPKPLDLAAIAARCAAPVVAAPGATLTSPQEAHLRFGPRWRVLTQTALGQGEGLARLALPEAARADRGYLLHPALMDLATGWAMDLIAGYAPDHLWVPVSYQSVRVFGPLPAEVVSWVRNAADNRMGGQSASFDVTIAAPDGTVCVEIAGFTIRKMEGALRFAAPAPAVAEVPRPLSPAEERLRHNLTMGIRAEEGAEAFLRAMALGQSQIVVSSLDLAALTAQAGAVDRVEASGQSFERPELESEFVPPANDIERRLGRVLAGFAGRRAGGRGRQLL